MGALYYDKFHAKRLVPYKSAIGDWLIPSHPTYQEVEENELKFVKEMARRKEEMQLLLHPDIEFSTKTELYRPMPVPEGSPRGVPIGRTLDVNKLEPRRQPKKHLQDLEEYRQSQSSS